MLAEGPHCAVDAVPVSGGKVTLWRLSGAATVRSEIQTIDVPIQCG